MNYELRNAAWGAYVSLCRLPVAERLTRQRILATLRDALAETYGQPPEEIQNEAEELALREGAP